MIVVLSHQVWGDIKQQPMTILLQILIKGCYDQKKLKMQVWHRMCETDTENAGSKCDRLESSLVLN